MSPKLKYFLFRWANNTMGVVVASYLLHGRITWVKPLDLIIAAFLLGILNTFVRPLLMLVSLPVLILTLGLFTFVINALLFWFVGHLGLGLVVDGFWPALFGSIVLWIVSWVLSAIFTPREA